MATRVLPCVSLPFCLHCLFCAVLTFLSGALNYQTVHHLLPSVSQYHYPAIAPIVQQVCKEYGVKYTHIPTFTEAFMCHLVHLRDHGIQALH